MQREVPLHGFLMWWRANRRRFLVTWLATTLLVLAIAIALGLDDTLRVGFAGLAGVVLLPFAIVLAVVGALATIFLPFFLFLLIAGVAGVDSSFHGVETHVIDPYYARIARQRSPIFWGIPVGLASALALLAVVATVRDSRAEREAKRAAGETERVLAQTKQRLDEELARGELPDTIAVSDGYGRPITYRLVVGHRQSSYTLTSSGADPRTPADDRCVEGFAFHGKRGALRWLASRAWHGPEPEPARCPER